MVTRYESDAPPYAFCARSVLLGRMKGLAEALHILRVHGDDWLGAMEAIDEHERSLYEEYDAGVESGHFE